MLFGRGEVVRKGEEKWADQDHGDEPQNDAEPNDREEALPKKVEAVAKLSGPRNQVAEQVFPDERIPGSTEKAETSRDYKGGREQGKDHDEEGGQQIHLRRAAPQLWANRVDKRPCGNDHQENGADEQEDAREREDRWAAKHAA